MSPPLPPKNTVEPDEKKPDSPPKPRFTVYPLLAGFNPQLKYNILKFAPSSNRKVDLASFVEPVKLNRKDPWAIRKKAEEEKQKALEAKIKAENSKSEGGPNEDDQMKIDPVDQKPSADSAAPPAKPARDDSIIAPGPASQPKLKPQPFKKKTKQVFIASDQAARMLKKEEYQSWLLEDGSVNGERWVGRYESAGAGTGPSLTASSSSSGNNNDASNYVLFRLDTTSMTDSLHNFEVIPCHRFYRFTQRPNYDTLGADEAEAAYEKMQKPTTKEDVGRWFMRRRGANLLSSQPHQGDKLSSTAQVKTEENQKSSSAGFFDHSKVTFGTQNHSRSQVQIPSFINGRKNKFTAVQGSQSNFDDDEEDKKPNIGQDGDFDEVDYEAEFDDDEEGAGNLNDEAMEEDELKEIADKMKREQLAAGKAGDEERDREDIDVEKDHLFGERADLTKEGKAVKKLLMRKGEDNVYDSDEDVRNPYASEEEESDLEEVVPSLTPNVPEGSQRSGTPVPGSQTNNPLNGSRNGIKGMGSQPTNKPLSRPPSRSSTPALGADGRMSSSHPSTFPAGGVNRSRGTSPQILPGGKGPYGTAGLPFAKPTPVSSPTHLSANGKRKQHPTGLVSAKEKKLNAGPGPSPGHTPPASQPSSAVIIKEQIIEVVRSRALTTKELLSHFKSRVQDEHHRQEISASLKEVGKLVDGLWYLKDGY